MPFQQFPDKPRLYPADEAGKSKVQVHILDPQVERTSSVTNCPATKRFICAGDGTGPRYGGADLNYVLVQRLPNLLRRPGLCFSFVYLSLSLSFVLFFRLLFALFLYSPVPPSLFSLSRSLAVSSSFSRAPTPLLSPPASLSSLSPSVATRDRRTAV